VRQCLNMKARKASVWVGVVATGAVVLVVTGAMFALAYASGTSHRQPPSMQRARSGVLGLAFVGCGHRNCTSRYIYRTADGTAQQVGSATCTQGGSSSSAPATYIESEVKLSARQLADVIRRIRGAGPTHAPPIAAGTVVEIGRCGPVAGEPPVVYANDRR
jgi:hypothetical protein